MPVYLLSEELLFPPVHLATPEGLLAVGGDLSPQRLLLAYRNGIFPWYSEQDPILWWSPDPRAILYPWEIKVSRTLKKTLRKSVFKVTMDACFEDTIRSCAQTRIEKDEGTWITGQMIRTYVRLHQLGYAHSVETWHQDRIVGGLYGVSIGNCFFGESMFSTMNDASKVAMVHLCRHLIKENIDFIDCQLPTNHLKGMGAREVPRDDFMAQLQHSLRYPTRKGPWSLSLQSGCSFEKL